MQHLPIERSDRASLREMPATCYTTVECGKVLFVCNLIREKMQKVDRQGGHDLMAAGRRLDRTVSEYRWSATRLTLQHAFVRCNL